MSSWLLTCGGRPEGGPQVGGGGGHWGMRPSWFSEAIRQAPNGSRYHEGGAGVQARPLFTALQRWQATPGLYS